MKLYCIVSIGNNDSWTPIQSGKTKSIFFFEDKEDAEREAEVLKNKVNKNLGNIDIVVVEVLADNESTDLYRLTR
jgi:hypothetical protein